jgi:hypothetical protein
MQTVIALLFCLLLGVMLKVDGVFALLWLPLGFAIGLFVTAQIALPVILGLPRAIRLVSRGEMRSGVYARLLITPVLWVVVLFVVLFLIGFFWPATAAWVAGNAALNVGTWLGIIPILLSPLSKKSRSNFREDFDRSYGQFYTGSSAATEALQERAAEPTEEDAARAELKRLRRDLDLLEDPETIFSFGQTSFDGDGIEQDYVAAANWFRIAAEQGHAKAQHNLALMYESGLGVRKDCSEAAKWYRLAADQGLASSQNNFGGLLEAGDGVEQDYVAALEWYRRAEQAGDPNASANVNRLSHVLKRK